MTILDRMFFKNYIKNYIIVFSCILTLYVVLDLFTNLNDFAGNRQGVFEMIQHIVGYYAVQVTIIFDKLAPAITVLAGMFTVVWMQKSNELLPQLSAGVSTYRVIRPIVFGCFCTLALSSVNTELIIPKLADQLTIARDDPERVKPVQVRGVYDPSTKDHFIGGEAFHNELKVKSFEYTSSVEGSGGLCHILATEAIYVPYTPNEPDSGGWKLFGSRTESESTALPKNVRMIGEGRYFIKTEVEFANMTRKHTWYVFAPTYTLWELLNSSETSRQSDIAVLFHMRLTRLVVGILMVVLCLSIILRDQNRDVLLSTGFCLIVMLAFFCIVYGCKYLGDYDFVPPPLAAWLPVMIFGPIVLAQYDAIHT